MITRLRVWLRRSGWRLLQLAVLAWIAIELHGIEAAIEAIQPTDMSGLDSLTDKLDDIAQAITLK